MSIVPLPQTSMESKRRDALEAWSVMEKCPHRTCPCARLDTKLTDSVAESWLDGVVKCLQLWSPGASPITLGSSPQDRPLARTWLKALETMGHRRFFHVAERRPLLVEQVLCKLDASSLFFTLVFCPVLMYVPWLMREVESRWERLRFRHERNTLHWVAAGRERRFAASEMPIVRHFWRQSATNQWSHRSQILARLVVLTCLVDETVHQAWFRLDGTELWSRVFLDLYQVNRVTRWCLTELTRYRKFPWLRDSDGRLTKLGRVLLERTGDLKCRSPSVSPGPPKQKQWISLLRFFQEDRRGGGLSN